MRGQIHAMGGGGILVQILDGDAGSLKLNQIVDLNGWEDGRTLDQNAFYHTFVSFALPFYQRNDNLNGPALNHDVLHAHFRDIIIGMDVQVCGKFCRVAPSTAKLGKRKFCEFIESCFRLAMEEAMVPVAAFVDRYESWKKAKCGKNYGNAEREVGR